MAEQPSGSNEWPRWLNGVVLVIFLAVAGFFLFTEHKAHVYGAFPYLLLGVCLALLFAVWRLAKRLPSGGEVSGSPQSVGKGKLR